MNGLLTPARAVGLAFVAIVALLVVGQVIHAIVQAIVACLIVVVIVLFGMYVTRQ